MIKKINPTLNLPFASMGQQNANDAFQNVGGVVTNSNGTRVNEKGLIETVPDNTLRVDYDPVTGECKGLLIEEERTNLVRSSEDFSGLWAVEGDSSVTTEDDFFLKRHTAPLASGQNRFRQGIGYDSDLTGRSFILSVILPPKSYFSDPTASITVGILANNVTSMVVTPSDYYKKFSMLVEPTGSSGFVICASQSTDLSLTKRLRIQLEEGSFPSSYIPTAGTAVTRTADNIRIPYSNLIKFYNNLEGTFIYNGSHGIGGASLTGDGVGDPALRIGARLVRINDGGYVLNYDNLSATIEGFTKIGVSIKSFDYAVAVNGDLKAIGGRKDELFTLSSTGVLYIGQDYAPSVSTGHIKSLIYYPVALPDTQMIQLTRND